MLKSLASNIGCSPWYNISRQYYQQLTVGGPLQYITGAVRFGGQAYLPRLGTTISDRSDVGVAHLINQVIDSGKNVEKPAFHINTGTPTTASSV